MKKIYCWLFGHNYDWDNSKEKKLGYWYGLFETTETTVVCKRCGDIHKSIFSRMF